MAEVSQLTNFDGFDLESVATGYMEGFSPTRRKWKVDRAIAPKTINGEQAVANGFVGPQGNLPHVKPARALQPICHQEGLPVDNGAPTALMPARPISPNAVGFNNASLFEAQNISDSSARQISQFDNTARPTQKHRSMDQSGSSIGANNPSQQVQPHQLQDLDLLDIFSPLAASLEQLGQGQDAPAVAPASAGQGIQDAKSVANAQAPSIASSSAQKSNRVVYSEEGHQDGEQDM